MTLVDGGIVCTLTAPGGAVLDHGGSLRWSWEVDKGWSWSATVVGVLSGTYDYRHSRDGVYVITADDGLGNTLTLASMAAGERTYTDPLSQTDPGTYTLQGTDVLSVRMGKPNQNFPSFRATTSTALIEELATRADVPITGLPDWYVGEEEVKGKSVRQALGPLQEVSAYDLVVWPDDTVTLTAWEEVGDALDFDWSTLKNSFDPNNIYTGKRLGKQSSIPAGENQEYRFTAADSYQQALSASMIGPGCYESDLLGAIAAVGFFDMDPGHVDAGLVAFYSFDPDYTAPAIASSSGPATHMTVVCKDIGMPYPVDAVLIVTGTPYGEEGLPAGTDLSFTTPEPTADPDTSLGDWPSPDDMIDPLFPGQGWAEDRQPYILAKENSGADKLLLDGVFQLSVALLQSLTYSSRVYKVWSLEWDPGSDNTNVVMVKQ